MTLIAIENLNVAFGGNTVLHGVDFTISKSEIVTILGPNGSGKTTLLRVILGAVRANGGDVQRQKDIKIGYVPQKLHIDTTLPLTVRRFLDLPRRISNADAQAALAQADCAGLIASQMTDLSGGQFQRVLLARALLNTPDLLVLDEPTQGLDQIGQAAFYQRIQSVRDQMGCAVLMVSHDLHVVMAASDRVVCLNGHVCCQGHPHQVASAPEYRALFGAGTRGALALYQHHHDHTHEATE
jgi:zinc transport system ATP-binding protein